MAKVQDTYNPVTGEYVKRISDWIDLSTVEMRANSYYANAKRFVKQFSNAIDVTTSAICLKYDSTQLTRANTSAGVSDTSQMASLGHIHINVSNKDTGMGFYSNPTNVEVMAYFYGWKMCNSDGTSPYYKSEVPYTPSTWAEWGKYGAVADETGATITSDGAQWRYISSPMPATMKTSTKYGFLYNVVSNNTTLSIRGTGGSMFSATTFPSSIGNNKVVATSAVSLSSYNVGIQVNMVEPAGNSIKFKDFRVFELPTGSQIEADFTNLSADELSVKYNFNGLCVKHWKKVTDGTGLTSNLPTASYEGYTPYRMIYQLATPEISYLTPKASIPLYNTNTIVETDTLADCKADVTVGYKLKDGVTAVIGDITAPTPDYMSVVNSVSEDGLGKGIVRSPNLIVNGNFANGTNEWGKASLTTSVLNNELTAIATSDWNGRIYQTIGGEGKYYIFADIKSPSGSVGININSYTTASVYHSGNGVYQRISAVLTSDISSTYMVIVDKNLVVNAKTFFVKNVGAVNLTQIFGAGNEPTKAQCDILFATWQDKASTQATLPTLRKIGTVADTYNPETGVLVQRIGKKVFDGTEDWLLGGTSPIYTRFYIRNVDNVAGLEDRSRVRSSSSHFTGASFTTLSSLVGNNVSSWIQDAGVGGLVPRIDISIDNNILKLLTPTQFKAYLAQQYANGTPVTVYYQLATPVVTTLTKTALPTYKPTTVIESDSTIKGNVSADYKLKANATSVAGDFIASPECVNDIKDLGNSIDVVSSVGRRNLLRNSGNFINTQDWAPYTSIDSYVVEEGRMKITTSSSGSPRLKNNTLIPLTQTRESYSIAVEYISLGTVTLTGKTSTSPTELNEYGAQNIGTITDIGTSNLDGNRKISKFGLLSLKKEAELESSWIMLNFPPSSTFEILNVKIEKNSTFSPWTPAPEEVPYNTITNGVYKTNILLSNPLRSVGTVKDRLFKDSDGKWKVERNIGKIVLNGTETWQDGSIKGENLKFGVNTTPFVKTGSPIVSDSFKAVVQGSVSGEIAQEQLTIYKHETVDEIRVNIHPSRLIAGVNVSGFKSWLGSHNISIEYQLATPTYETLSQELQTDLDNIPTFPEHNYVYTVANDNLQPTLHVDYKKLSWLKSRLLLNSLKIYSRNLTDAEMIKNYKVEKERFGM